MVNNENMKEEYISKYVLIGTGIGPIVGVMISSFFEYDNLGKGMLYGTTFGILTGLIIGVIKYKRNK